MSPHQQDSHGEKHGKVWDADTKLATGKNNS